jgi:hypothetical protein
MYYDFNAGSKTYQLRLNTRNIVALEKQLGCNPLAIFGAGDRIPTITEMVTVLHQSLTQYNHGITVLDAYDIFDAYLADGHTSTDFISVIVDIYKVSGIIANDTEKIETEKN